MKIKKGQKVIYKYRCFNDGNSNLIYNYLLLNGKDLNNLFYWKYDGHGIIHNYKDKYDLDELRHLFHVYQNDKIFHVYFLQKGLSPNTTDMELRLIVLDEGLLEKKEDVKKESKYLI